MLTGYALREGRRIPIKGRTVSDMEREAEKLGAKHYRYGIAGGVASVRMLKIAGEWVELESIPPRGAGV